VTIWGIGPRMFLYTALISSPLLVAYGYDTGRFTTTWIPSMPACLLGGVWIAAGLAILCIAARHISRNFKAGQLCDSGIYSLCRNPMYAGWILFVLPGIAILLRAPILWIVPGIMYLVLARMIRREEEYLQAVFGERYKRYRESVGLLLPKRRKQRAD
jgi:protein-S-isoprenylcysteine O-methyltransferase Ste14